MRSVKSHNFLPSGYIPKLANTLQTASQGVATIRAEKRGTPPPNNIRDNRPGSQVHNLGEGRTFRLDGCPV